MALGNMMHGVGGIGQQAADLRDGGMSPKQLQQGYQKSVQEGKPSLPALLALNAIMKDVKAKEKEFQLAMEPKEPGTILEQRAKELKDMTVGQNTSEKAEQVGGIAQLQQKQQQQNIQRMAQGPQGVPQMALQGAPQMAAHGGIIMQGAPNLQRMAGGGIVGFAEGDLVDTTLTQNLTEEQTRFLRSQGFSAAQVASMTPDRLNDVLLGMRTTVPPMSGREQALRKLQSTPRGRAYQGTQPPTIGQRAAVGLPNIVPAASVLIPNNTSFNLLGVILAT